MIGQLLWLLLPAMTANMAPVFAARYKLLPALDLPLDGGYSWNGRRVFGSHKTYRGVIVGIFTGTVFATFQYFFSPFVFLNLNTPLQSLPTAAAFGACLGFAALVGDALKSFFKRRFSIRPGRSWPIFDQVDFVIASLIALSFFVPVSLTDAVLLVSIIGVASLTTSIIGVVFKIKDSL